MDYNFTASGIVYTGGCSLYKLVHLFHVKFKVGSIVYSKPKALKGKLEKIVIKKHRLFPERENSLNTVCQICTFPPLYIDTLNAYHNEEDLVGPEEAFTLIENYNLFQRALLELAKIQNC